MKHIFLNLKRFDVPVEMGGVNRLAPVADWGKAVVEGTQDGLAAYDKNEVEFAAYLPEAHLLSAAAARKPGCALQLGCQGVFRADTAVGGNFGAFTTNRPAIRCGGSGLRERPHRPLRGAQRQDGHPGRGRCHRRWRLPAPSTAC